MRKLNIKLLIGAALLFFAACQSEPPPRSPEEVLKDYQALVDQNQLEAAKDLSTPAGQQWLDELAGIIEDELPDSTLFHTEFLSIACTGDGDTLLCQCVLQDQYERYNSTYIMVRTDGQWRVDAPRDEIQIDDDILENLPDSLLEEMMGEDFMN